MESMRSGDLLEPSWIDAEEMTAWHKDGMGKINAKERVPVTRGTDRDQETPNEIMDQGNDQRGLLRTLGKC